MKKNLGKIIVPNLESESHKVLLGRKMRMLRENAGLNQSDVQEALGYDSNGMVSLIENGKSGMRIEQIYKAAKFFGVHPFVLLSDDDLDDEKLQIYMNISKLLKQKERSRHLDTIKALIEIAINE
jgi:transcriptional regulator with XRE-family HTH domain